jgi:hypothetical protein
LENLKEELSGLSGRPVPLGNRQKIAKRQFIK